MTMIFKGVAGMKRTGTLLALLVAAVCLLSACTGGNGGLADGYYTAIMADYDTYGWREYVTLCISDQAIVSVEYNAENVSGMVKSWDMDYMREMNAISFTYPNEYTRLYSEALLAQQDPDRVDAITGATGSHACFVALAHAALANARVGDHSVAQVTLP